MIPRTFTIIQKKYFKGGFTTVHEKGRLTLRALLDETDFSDSEVEDIIMLRPGCQVTFAGFLHFESDSDKIIIQRENA